MLIKKIVLHRFKRFFITGVEHFEYEPKSNISIIAWANGYGKSSLLSEISPLPSDLKKDYREGGYKYLELNYKGKEYIVSSGYNGKHSFIVDGNELNTGGTARVQKDLSYEHFGITTDNFDILLGKECLTNMTPMVRKKWFTSISPIDYTFSIKVFNNLKSRYRDIVGSIKLLQEDLIKRTNNIVDKDNIDKIKKEYDRLDKTILELSKMLLKTTKPNEVSIEDKIVEYNRFIKELNNLEVDEVSIDKAKYNLGNYESDLRKINEDIYRNNKILETLDKVSNDNLKDLKETKGKLVNDIDNLKELLPKDIVNGTSELCIEKLNEISNKSEYYLEILKKPIEEVNLNTLREELANLKDKHTELKTLYLTSNNEYETLIASSNNDIICPKCNHSFKIANSKRLEMLKSIINTTKEELVKLTNIIKSKIELEAKLIDRQDNINKLLNILHSESILKPFLGNITDNELDRIPTILNTARVKIMNFSKYDILLKQLDNINNKIVSVEEANKIVKDLNISNKEALEKVIEELTTRRATTIKLIKDTRMYISLNEQLDEVMKGIKEYQDYKVDEYEYLVTMKQNDIILNGISEMKVQLSKIQKVIQESDINSARIKDIQDTIDNNKKDIDILGRMIEALSPDGGLIARSINSFLNVFINEMNHIINSVWRYSIELLPCDIEDNDLNYKFKVRVNHDEVIEDVNKLSSSMQEIVNLAFKVVFIKYSKLTYYPLILDEFGRTMDPEHRVNAYDIIDKVLSHNFNHIILVCHFESMYSRFFNCDILELKEYKNTIKE